ncbi:MAG: GHKL domain-containing protein, partial [Nitrospirae bacterium]|nr:GHKL domain-containing protein [Nitrospirota bacterium]
VDDLTELLRAQKAAAWQEVAQRIAHEIKNPLTPIHLSAQRLRKRFQAGGEAARKIVEEATDTIIHQVESLKRLVDEFSRFARMPEVHLLPGDLHQILSEVVHLYAGAHKEIAVLTDFADDLPPVLLDKEQLRRVLINLFDNAMEAMQRRGRIWVSTRYDVRQQRVRAEVADEGCGIAPEDQDKLFLPYFSRKRSGTGLGLAIAKRIITDHHGLIEAKPNMPRGTRFIIELPAPASPAGRHAA